MGGGRSFLGEPDELILAPDSESLRGLVDQKYSFSSWIRLDRLPEERINEAFFALGYDQSPSLSLFDDPSLLFSLEPTGSAILKEGPNENGLEFNSVDDLKKLNLGVSRSSGFLTAFLTRFTATESGEYEFRAITSDDDFFSLWFDLNRDGNFSADENLPFRFENLTAA